MLNSISENNNGLSLLNRGISEKKRFEYEPNPARNDLKLSLRNEEELGLKYILELSLLELI